MRLQNGSSSGLGRPVSDYVGRLGHRAASLGQYDSDTIPPMVHAPSMPFQLAPQRRQRAHAATAGVRAARRLGPHDQLPPPPPPPRRSRVAAPPAPRDRARSVAAAARKMAAGGAEEDRRGRGRGRVRRKVAAGRRARLPRLTPGRGWRLCGAAGRGWGREEVPAGGQGAGQGSCGGVGGAERGEGGGSDGWPGGIGGRWNGWLRAGMLGGGGVSGGCGCEEMRAEPSLRRGG